MKLSFILNDYLLAWNLLFKPSFCEEIQKLKERQWRNHQQIYTAMENENIEILKYGDDFIPDDNTVYDEIFESEIFKEIKNETETHRKFLLDAWDNNRQEINDKFKTVVRFKLKDKFKILVVHPMLDCVEYIKSNPTKRISWGKADDAEDSFKTLMRIIYTILKYEIGDYQKDNKEIVSAIIDLAVTNEMATLIKGKSQYQEGFQKLNKLKQELYPYWLMYLGADEEALLNYMMRDQTSFEIDDYPLEPQLAKVDLYGFIDFCSHNKKYLIRSLSFRE